MRNQRTREPVMLEGRGVVYQERLSRETFLEAAEGLGVEMQDGSHARGYILVRRVEVSAGVLSFQWVQGKWRGGRGVDVLDEAVSASGRGVGFERVVWVGIN